MNRSRGIYRQLAIITFAIILGVFVLAIGLSSSAQWDFKIVYTSAAAYRLGLNPYDSAVLSSMAIEPLIAGARFVYPPHALFIFRPFTWVGYPAALVVYLTLKVAVACALVFLWRRIFAIGKHTWLLLLFAPLAFNAALLTDLRSGNSSVFEQFFIWTAFYCYLKGRIGWFCTAILCAASVKLVPVLLLGFLLTTGRKRDVAYFLIFALLFTGAMVLNAAVWPELTSAFLRSVRGIEGERGLFNPSTWSLIRDAGLWFQLNVGLAIPVIALLAVYFAVVATASLISLLAIRRSWSWDREKAQLWLICLVCLLYAIAVPRFKNYSYILLIAPSYYVLMSSRLPSPLILACALLMISTNPNFLVFGRAFAPFYRLQLEYYSLVTAWLVWGLCCYSMMSPKPEPQTKGIPSGD